MTTKIKFKVRMAQGTGDRNEAETSARAHKGHVEAVLAAHAKEEGGLYKEMRDTEEAVSLVGETRKRQTTSAKDERAKDETLVATPRVKDALKLMTATMVGRLGGGYQHRGVRWMLTRELEAKRAKGGILADDMGMGKTIQMIATMRGNPQRTLIVVPNGKEFDWKDELKNFGGYKRIYMVAANCDRMLPDDADVVITPYSSFKQKIPPATLQAVQWGRIVLDEGHHIKDPKCKTSTTIAKLSADIKWAMTATPVQNSIDEVLSVAKWIGVSGTFKEIDDDIVLRRRQIDEGEKDSRIKLPELETVIVRLPFKYDVERDVYNAVHDYYKSKTEESKSNNIAIHGIARCRQVCAHLGIYREGIKLKKANPAKEIDEDGPENLKVFKRLVNGREVRSTKMEWIVDDIETFVKTIPKRAPHEEERKLPKCLVFCHFTGEIQRIAKRLRDRGIASIKYDGSMDQAEKRAAIEDFFETSFQVMILQISCGGTGLNLQCATRVYTTTPHMNPCIELQASARAHRRGQNFKVTWVRIVMENTVEEACMNLQNYKAQLIDVAMHDDSIHKRLGTGEDDEDKRTLNAQKRLEDYRHIFDRSTDALSKKRKTKANTTSSEQSDQSHQTNEGNPDTEEQPAAPQRKRRRLSLSLKLKRSNTSAEEQTSTVPTIVQHDTAPADEPMTSTHVEEATQTIVQNDTTPADEPMTSTIVQEEAMTAAPLAEEPMTSTREEDATPTIVQHDTALADEPMTSTREEDATPTIVQHDTALADEPMTSTRDEDATPTIVQHDTALADEPMTSTRDEDATPTIVQEEAMTAAPLAEEPMTSTRDEDATSTIVRDEAMTTATPADEATASAPPTSVQEEAAAPESTIMKEEVEEAKDDADDDVWNDFGSRVG